MEEKGIKIYFDCLDALEKLNGNDFKTVILSMAEACSSSKTNE